jgi:hypothetical protein
MTKGFAILLLLSGILYADEAADRVAIDRTVGALNDPNIRADPNQMAKLVTPDFDGTFGIPSARFVPGPVTFIAPEVAVAEGGSTSSPPWLMVMKKSGAEWKISSVRSVFSHPIALASNITGDASDREAIRRAVTLPGAIHARSPEIWCELDCMQFNTVSSIKIIAPGVALADGEIRAGMMPVNRWVAIVKKDGADWHVALFRSLEAGVVPLRTQYIK